MNKTACFLIGLSLLFTGCEKESSNGKRTIAVIPKGTTHEFWKSVKAGADQAALEKDVNIIWKGPLKEDDRAAQIAVVQQFVSDNVAGIVLAPLDENALVVAVTQANKKNIPTVIFDSPLAGGASTGVVSLVATDNVEGGRIGGNKLAELIGKKGSVILLRYQEGSASTMAREKGFLEAIAAHPEIKVLVENRYAGPTSDTAKQASMNMLDLIKDANGVFCPNESSAVGMLLALKQAGLAAKVKFVGFDTSDTLLNALKANELDGLVAQNPRKMGYEAVRTMVDHLDGKPAPKMVDTGVQLITRDNLESAEVKMLLGSK